MRKLFFGVFGFTALFASARPARADVTLFTEVNEGAKKQEATIYLTANRLRAESAERGAPMVMIFDGTAKKVMVLHPDRKTYFEMTGATMQHMREQTGQLAQASQMSPQVKAALEERMATMPPAQRAQVEAMLAQRGTGGPRATEATPKERALAFEKMGSKRTVNGFACEMYRVTDGGQPFEEDCIAPFGAGTFTKEDAATFRSVSESMRETMGQAPSSRMEDFSKYPGVPVERKKMAGPQAGRVETIKRIQHGSLAVGLFAVPAGYTLDQAGFGSGMGAGH